MTIRTEKKDNYTVADNGYIRDERLSWQAKGLMTYLLSLPDDWEINISELVNHSADGIYATRAAVKELQKSGYLRAEKVKAKGRFAGVRYVVMECPPCDGFPHTEKPHTENRTLLNTNILNTNNTKYLMTKEERAEKPRFIPPTPQQVRDYAQEKGLALDADSFCDFYQSKNWFVGKTKMKDWKAAARNWARRGEWKPRLKAIPDFDKPEQIGEILF